MLRVGGVHPPHRSEREGDPLPQCQGVGRWFIHLLNRCGELVRQCQRLFSPTPAVAVAASAATPVVNTEQIEDSSYLCSASVVVEPRSQTTPTDVFVSPPDIIALPTASARARGVGMLSAGTRYPASPHMPQNRRLSGEQWQWSPSDRLQAGGCLPGPCCPQGMSETENKIARWPARSPRTPRNEERCRRLIRTLHIYSRPGELDLVTL